MVNIWSTSPRTKIDLYSSFNLNRKQMHALSQAAAFRMERFSCMICVNLFIIDHNKSYIWSVI